MSNILDKEFTAKPSPYEVMAIFPLPVYKTNIGREFTKQEQDEFDIIVSEQLVHDEMYYNEYKRGEQYKKISHDKYLLNRKSFLSIRTFFEQHLKEFVTSVMGIDTAETSWSPYITQSWINVYESSHHNPFHLHRNSIISGVFYINCLELPGNKTDGILFEGNIHQMYYEIDLPIAQDTMFSDKPYFIPVVAGDLVLFPSTTMHSVNLNETSDQTRKSFAFNSV